jgi:hypothetical protein
LGYYRLLFDRIFSGWSSNQDSIRPYGHWSAGAPYPEFLGVRWRANSTVYAWFVKKLRKVYEDNTWSKRSLRYGLSNPSSGENMELEQQAEEELTEIVHQIAEKYQLSPASMKVILSNIAENINPYVDVEELKEQ